MIAWLPVLGDYITGAWRHPSAVPVEPPRETASAAGAPPTPAAPLPPAGHFYHDRVHGMRYLYSCRSPRYCPDEAAHRKALQKEETEPANNCGFGEYLRACNA